MSLFTLPIVLDVVAKASLILAATALVAAALRHASASARHFVWTLGLLSALAAPALSVTLPRWELPIVTIAATPAPGTTSAQGSAPVEITNSPTHQLAKSIDAPSLGDARRGDAVATPTRASAPAPARVMPSWPTIALFAWAAGASLILARMIVGLLAVLWMSRRTPAVTSAPWLAQAQSLARDLGLKNVRFLRTGASRMPMAWGIFRPSVLMPADADTWPAHRVRVVLLHELAHVKRRDCLTHLVAQIACAAYWFNPLAWMAARHLRTERERACDDLVLAAGTRGSDYADQLLDIARVMRAGRFPAVLAGASLAMAQRSQLEGRLMAILDPSVPRRGLTRARAAAAATVFALVIVPVASVQPWAEEMAAVNSAVSDANAAQDSQAAQPPQRPIEQRAGQAPADNRANAEPPNVIQGVVQGNPQGRVQGKIQGTVQGRIQGGIQAGIQGGIPGGVNGGIDALASAVGSAVGSAIGNGVAAGIANGVAAGLGHQADVDKDKDKDKDKDAQTRASGKGRTLDPRTVNALMEALKDSDKEVRETAMNVLVQMRDPRMFEPLVAALKDTSADVREHAAFGLGQLRDVRAIEPLAGALKDSTAGVREQAVFALGQLRAAAAIDAISTAVRDTNPGVREQAVFALGQIRDRRSVEPLISALKDENPGVREQAAFALGQIRDPRAVEALVVALKDANPGVREQVVFALGQLRDPRAIDGLMGALKDASASVRKQAAFALGQIR